MLKYNTMIQIERLAYLHFSKRKLASSSLSLVFLLLRLNVCACGGGLEMFDSSSRAGWRHDKLQAAGVVSREDARRPVVRHTEFTQRMIKGCGVSFKETYSDVWRGWRFSRRPSVSHSEQVALLGVLMRWLATGTSRMLMITDEVLGEFFIGNRLIAISCSL